MDIVTIDGIPVYQALVDGADCGMLRISLVDDPAVQSNFLAFKKQEPRRMQAYSIQDEDKHLVLGVVMRADFPIYRRDGDFEYYVIYKADTIRAMAEKYLAENRQNLVNIMHEDGTDQEGVQMVQYFIKGAGISPDGFDDIADGSLFAEFHVTNEDVWTAIKEGTYKGFSLEGLFDLVPERSLDYVDEVVAALDGIFSRLFKNSKQYAKMKKNGLLARLARALVAMGNVTTDKGILKWDGDEDLEAGDNVYIEDADGNQTPAEDGEYVTGDGKTIVVVSGKVSEIRDPKAEVAPEEGAAEVRAVETDKGKLVWDNEEEDLKAGDAVYIVDEDGNRNPAPDGDYTTEDGKVIVVVDGKVSEIRDTKAEVAAREERMRRISAAFSESYDEKRRKIYEAIYALGYDPYGWMADCGDDFAIYETYDENYDSHYTRFAVSWDADGNAIVSNPTEVKMMFVPVDFVSPFENPEAAVEEMAAIRKENTEMKAQLEALARTPAGRAAHLQHEKQEEGTGNKKMDNLIRIARAK